MKLTRKQMIMISLMLFSMFFGAGNLIFPPFLGHAAGANTTAAILGFLITAVVLPVLGVVVVSQFDGLDRLGAKVGKHFSLIFTILVYVALGPGLAIPRAASVPFEMAVAPYMPKNANLTIWMLIYSLIFFAIALWLCLNPGKIVDWLGIILTPALLLLLLVLCIGFLLRGETAVAAPQTAYEATPFLQGFTEGYLTMDTLAGLNFGIVIATTLGSFGMTEKKSILRSTVWAGIFAGAILAVVYLMLTYMGMYSSAVYPIQDNGAWTLRCIVSQVFGMPGAILLAAIFTLACLTTCVGLINSVSQYFSTLWKKISYRGWVYIITGFSFFISNLGLSTILSISVPILNAIYPIAIVLIILGLSHKLWEKNAYAYPLTVSGTTAVSVIYALDSAGMQLGFVTSAFRLLPGYGPGFGWLSIAAVMLVISLLLPKKKG
ncbi:MAG: branched-chain amino acid transport system II carrier protein [Oscillospiraceae bacterium]|nr:branched-chain amino acid transport system II carrier protein [Oscillospiraceae bacterium]